ncbi:MAG: hypothetical protein LBL31_01990 [Spirochaetaceae bacterium]|nr:hypothetical protein [Spirochaetaceae bacterium]
MKTKRFFLFGLPAVLLAVSASLAMGLVLTGCGGDDGDGPTKIRTAAQFNAIRNQLDGHYVLEADIDLTPYSNFEPIGTFVPVSDAPEDEENPTLELAFTGVFDGNGRTISNVTINAPEAAGVGLFGCVTGDSGTVKNLVVENVTVTGMMAVGGVIGYGATANTIENITLRGENNITGGFLVGGIVGGGFCDINNCNATANVVLNGNNAQGIGILAGGMENSSIISSRASGTVTATGNGNFSIGGLAACGQEAPEIKDCTVNNVTITVGENCFMIGGLIGHVGKSYDNSDPTIIDNCKATNVTISAPSSAERIGGIAGSGFYYSVYSEYRPNPNAFIIRNSSSSGSISGGCTDLVGKIAGYVYDNSTVENTCTSTMTGASNNAGGDKNSAGLDTLK